jgi:hypothetical protein
MNLLLVWFIIYLSLSTKVLANVEFYADENPEDYVTEEVARRFRQEDQRRPFNSPGEIPKQTPHRGFTYRSPGRSTSLGNISPFAVSQSDPESKSDEDYDGFALDPDPEYQILGIPQQAGEKTKGTNLHSSEETEPESYHLHKTPVPADPGNKFSLYSLALLFVCCAAAAVGMTAVGIIWYKLQKNAKRAADVKYPANGATGSSTEDSPMGDKRLAWSAQVYHFLHQKEQIITVESGNEYTSATESGEESEGDITLYEELLRINSKCDVEVPNPLFRVDPTPATSEVTPAAECSAVSEHVSSSTADDKKRGPS